MNSPEFWDQAENLFHAALEHAPEARAGFLDAACGADKELRAEVAALLAAHAKEGSFIDTPAHAAPFTAPAMESLIGRSIKHYQVLSLLGIGGMGAVYLAHDEKLQRQVAIKALAFNPLFASQGYTRLFTEAQATAKLDHPNVCTIHEVIEDEARCFIVMQYVEGETLAARLKRGPLTLSEALEIAVPVADALAEAHRVGITHRDIKPQNIMLSTRGLVKVLDFGIAQLQELSESERRGEGEMGEGGDKEMGGWGEVDLAASPHRRVSPSPRRPVSPARTTPGLIFGTPGYLSPEQARSEAVDGRSDLFSLGVVMFEMLTGTAPFEAESVSEAIAKTLTAEPPPLERWLPEAPTEWSSVVKKALAKEPEERYQTAGEMMADLRQLEENLERAGSAAPEPPRSALRPWLAAATVMLAVVLALFLTLLRRTDPSASEPKHPATPAAAEAYQKGRAALQYESGGHAIRKEAVEHFTRVIELEPNFAPAYAALSLAYNNLRDHDVPRAERVPKAKETALKALTLDPTLADAHFTLAELYFEQEWRFAEAEREYQLAIQYNPKAAEIYYRYATKLAELGKFAAAQEAMKRAAQLEPYSEHQDNHLASVLYFSRQYDQLLTHANQMLAKYGSRLPPKTYFVQAYLGQGQYELAVAEIEKNAERNSVATSIRGVAYALAGRRPEAVQIADRIQTAATDGHAFSLARIYAALGEAETAFAWLEKAYTRRDAVMITLKVDLAFDHIRSDPRFAEMLRRIGFPD